MLIYKIALEASVRERPADNGLRFESISESLISNDPWLNESRALLRRHLNSGYYGFAVYEKRSEQCVGYSWYAINRKPPTSIPNVPRRCAWIFNMMVNERFRGSGLQKMFLTYFAEIVNENHSNSVDYLYADILADNIPSRKNFLKMGYLENGVYYIFIVGIRRYPFLNIKIGRWEKNQSHPIIQ